MTPLHSWAAAAVAGLALALGGASALAAEPLQNVRIGALRADGLIRIYRADRAGYFAQEGLKVDLTLLGSGPAVTSAVVSRSVDVGYSAIVPGIFARASGQPYRMFMAINTESGATGHQGTWLAVRGKDNLPDLKSLAGRTVALNASGGLCELTLRDHLAKAGVSYDSVKKIVVPFAQMQAALELGNADAACLTEPFYASARLSPKVRARAVSAGMIADMQADARIAQDGMFVRDDWGSANKDVLRKLVRAVARASEDYRKDPGLYRRDMAQEFKFSAQVADAMTIYFEFGDLAIKARDVSPLVAAMQRNGLLKPDFRAEDAVLPLE